jgi:hypothetical protein
MPHNANVDLAWASLRMVTTDLDPDHVTRRLGIEPHEAFRRGDPFGKRGLVHKNGYRGLSSEGHVPTNDLEEHIAWLLDRIEPVAERFMALRAEGIPANVFCFLRLRDYGGPGFSPQLMRRLAALDLELGLDIYWTDEEPA